MKLLQISLLVLIGFLTIAEAKRGKGKGKGRGKWGGRGKGKGKGGRGGFGAGRIINTLIKDDLMTCKVDECWPTCFTQGCIDCKTACYNENQNLDKAKNTDKIGEEPTKAERKAARKARKVVKACNQNCKKSGVCPKWKNVPKTCKKCTKGCYKKTLENSKSLNDFSKSCSGEDKCGKVCWGPAWKTKACKSCVSENCVEEE